MYTSGVMVVCFSNSNSRQVMDGTVTITDDASTTPIMMSVDVGCGTENVTSPGDIFNGCSLWQGEAYFCDFHYRDVILECEGDSLAMFG